MAAESEAHYCSETMEVDGEQGEENDSSCDDGRFRMQHRVDL